MSNLDSNIFIIANKNNMKYCKNINTPYKKNEKELDSANNPNTFYLNKISKQYNIPINFINLLEVDNLNQPMEKLISDCLTRKRNGNNRTKRNSFNNFNDQKENFNFINIKRSSHLEYKQTTISPRKDQRESCTII